MKKQRIYQIWKDGAKIFEGRLDLKDRQKATKLGYEVIKTQSFYKFY